MPKELEAGLLYVSERFGVAGHLCACGCRNKVIVPLGGAEWEFEENDGRPTLWPSIGSWQLPCQSHYWIIDGEVKSAKRWSKAQIERGRRAEDERRRAFYQVGQKPPTRALHDEWERLEQLLDRDDGEESGGDAQ
jgi:hypothetical protein